MNKRVALLTLLAFVIAPFAAQAQRQTEKVWHIGYLSPLSGPDGMVESFRDELHKLGYVEPRNLVIEYRWAGGDNNRLQQFADELVRQKVDAIVTTTTLVASTAKHATSTIPLYLRALITLPEGVPFPTTKEEVLRRFVATSSRGPIEWPARSQFGIKSTS